MKDSIQIVQNNLAIVQDINPSLADQALFLFVSTELTVSFASHHVEASLSPVTRSQPTCTNTSPSPMTKSFDCQEKQSPWLYIRSVLHIHTNSGETIPYQSKTFVRAQEVSQYGILTLAQQTGLKHSTDDLVWLFT